MTLDEFIEELKPLVQWNDQEKVHYMGSTILTNQEVGYMLEKLIDKEYTNKSSKERTKMRQRVFKECM